MSTKQHQISMRRHYIVFMFMTLASLASGRYTAMVIMLGLNAVAWCLAILVLSKDINESDEPS